LSFRAAFSPTLHCPFAFVVVCIVSTCAQADSGPQPDVDITIRGVADGIVEQGEPMRVAVFVEMDQDSEAGDVLLAPASGTWADAMDVAIVHPDGSPTAVSGTMVGKPDQAAATLSPAMAAEGMWRFVPDATGPLPAGDYAVRARLAVPSAAPGSGGWTGEVLSPLVPLRIVAASDDPGRRSQHALALAQDAIIDDRLEDAAGIVDALLAEQSDNIGAWTVRSVISERAGNIPGALMSVNRARRLYFGDEPSGKLTEPNVELETIYQRLLDALETPDTGNPEPEWSWPPAALLGLPAAGPPGVLRAVPEAAAATPQTAPASTARTPELPPPPATATAPTKAPVNVAPATATEVSVVPTTQADEAAFLADPNGQWATSASASSEYAHDRYSAMQATGAPDVDTYSDNPNAWCNSGASTKEDWLELGFARPVTATELRVRQNYTPGTIAKVEAIAADGRAQLLWEGTDPNVYPDRQIAWFVLRFPAPPFPVSKIRLTLNVAALNGWKQIDAVQLVGSPSDTR
jgi:hypothetical protein